MGYYCHSCGQEHQDLPDIGSDRPDYYWQVPEAEREARIQLTTDTCIIDSEDFYVRGVLELPILNAGTCLGFGVWVSHKRENFQIYIANPQSPDIGPFLVG